MGYYLRNNAWSVILNAIGASILILASPEVLAFEERYLGESFPITTGASIGLFGAWFVRVFVRKAKGALAKLFNGKGDE